MPKVSVLMPVYNTDESYLREAIESVLAQTLKDFEFIIVNDGSDNNVEEVILSYRDSRIIYYKNEANIGLSATRNKLFDFARGEFYAIMDSDDISLPDRLQEQVDFLEKNPDVGCCGAWIDFFSCPERKNDGRHPFEVSYLELLKGWRINHPTVVFRASVIDTFNLRYDLNYSCAEDYELWSRLVRYTKIRNLQKVLVKYRWHSSNTSVVKEKEMQLLSNRIRQNMLRFLTEAESEQKGISEVISDRKEKSKKIKIYLLGIKILTIDVR